MITFKKNVTEDSFYLAYAKVLNGILRLSNRETEVFSLYMSLTKEDPIHTITSDIRAAVCSQLGMSKQHLHRVEQTLIKKNILTGTSRVKRLNQTLIPKLENNECLIQFSFNLV